MQLLFILIHSEMFPELGTAAIHADVSDIAELLTTCDIDYKDVFFFNGNIGWLFQNVPTITFAVFGDSVEVLEEIFAVICSRISPGFARAS